MLNLAGLGLEFRPTLTASLAQQAMAIMQKYNASAWLPFSGRNAEYNTSDSLGVSLSTIGGSVGFVADYVKEFAPENICHNSLFVGANPATNSIPGVLITSSAEIIAKLEGNGIDSNGPYIDVSFKGLSSVGRFPNVRFNSPTFVVTSGDLFSLDIDVEVLRHNYEPHLYITQVVGTTAADAFVEANSPPISLAPGRRRYRAARVLSNALTARALGNFQINTLANVPVDALIRIWRPHFHRGFGAAYVETSGSAVLRAGYSSLVQETTGFKPVLTNDQLWTFDGVDDRFGSSTPTVTNPTGDCFRVAGWQLPAVAPPATQIIVAGTVGDAGLGRSLEFFLSTGSINACVIHRDDLGNAFTHAPARTANEKIIASVVRSGDSHTSRFRGDLGAISTSTAVQAMTAWTPLYDRVGCFFAGGANSLFFPGPIYGSIQGQGAPTPAEILILEDFLAAHAGITLV